MVHFMQDKYQHLNVEITARQHWAQPLWNGHEAYRVSEGALDALGKPKPKFYACYDEGY